MLKEKIFVFIQFLCLKDLLRDGIKQNDGMTERKTY